jgi:hypothetical protein
MRERTFLTNTDSYTEIYKAESRIKVCQIELIGLIKITQPLLGTSFENLPFGNQLVISYKNI